MIANQTIQTFGGARVARFRRACCFSALKSLVGATLFAMFAAPGRADTPVTEPYPTMAPLEQYLMPRDAEIAMARSAAPESISRDAEVLVLGRHGYEVAEPGHNGFVCIVQRSWESPSDSPEFWNPKGRGPICWNAAAAHYCLPLTIKKAEMVLAGKSKSEIKAAMLASFNAGEFPTLGVGAMCYMMSKQGYLNDLGKHWHPHLMFYLPVELASRWGANQPGSPTIASIQDLDHMTIFMVPVRSWSDGAPDITAAELELCTPTPNPAAPLPAPAKT